MTVAERAHEPTLLCPQCSLRFSADQRFCPECRLPLVIEARDGAAEAGVAVGSTSPIMASCWASVPMISHARLISSVSSSLVSATK